MNNIVSRPYQTANPKQYCERCVFGTGRHADFCADPTVLAVRTALHDAYSRSGQLFRDYSREFSK
jgi:hypothetical protein